MIAYAIDAALKSEIFDTVMVSTDSEEIAEISRQYGAEVPFMRSEKTASDNATTFDALDEVICEYKKLGKEFDTLCCIYPCVPFLKAETIRDAYKNMKGFDAVVPVCKYPVPIEWALKIKSGLLVPNDPEAREIRSQDLEPAYYDAGMFYFCKVKSMYENNSLIPENSSAYIIDEKECQDIDTPEDWQNAQIKYEILNNVQIRS